MEEQAIAIALLHRYNIKATEEVVKTVIHILRTDGYEFTKNLLQIASEL